ncbi:hypothetical protein GIB67_039585 [Kingdonia uniflora]|uniref:Uncharacterized protein n=1 Tax=Kingdonia uniflora TaxID=39325 RepID=A0A7J7P6G5_9MAGN|nr:hypothetical protein GIB67_039585 [Kingdonia uniflora]
MVAELPWILKMGNQVSHNLKHVVLTLDPTKKNPNNSNNNTKKPQQVIGILSFEVANVMSRIVNLHKSLTDTEISRLKAWILGSQGVKTLVSDDEGYLFELALSEKLDELTRIASVVSRLGKRCSEPALHGFEHVYGDIMSGLIDVKQLGFLVKDMEGMVKKMERFVTSTSSLYSETQVLNELEQASKKFQQTQHEESRRVYEEKLVWQRQDVKHLRDVSLWNQTYDKILALLVRTVCTIYARICIVFGNSVTKLESPSGQFSGQIGRHSGVLQRVPTKARGSNSGTLQKSVTLQRNLGHTLRPQDMSFPCGASPSRLFMDCLSLSSSSSSTPDEAVEDDTRFHSSANVSGLIREQLYVSDRSSRVRKPGPKSRLMMHVAPSTVGGSALALHYANVINVIERYLMYPELIGDEARDDLYQMLPTSLRASLKTNLKKYAKDLAIYDAPVAHDWKETLDKILSWLSPLARNMMLWQAERNLEQQQIISRTNVLLLQTLYFADKEKTEAAICELLVGLNYICRYEQQQNALLDCASSFDLDDCMEWQRQHSFI